MATMYVTYIIAHVISVDAQINIYVYQQTRKT